jgi:hypothetical protein
MINLRKYFGAEINSYNDYSYNFSPFIDFDFLSAYFNSHFCGVYYPYNSNSLLLKKQTSSLYYDLIYRNYRPLVYYPTSRGYSMADTQTIKGTFRILFSMIMRTKNNTDAFNTKPTDDIFRNIICEENSKLIESSLPVDPAIVTNENNASTLSLYYWLLKIFEKYMTN